MPVAEIGQFELSYEVLGEGQPWVLTPGGRFSKDFGGVREMAERLASEGRKVIIWDRPNCGGSAVDFTGQSESVMQADALAALLRHLDVGPTVLIGGSGGSRVSLLTAARHPDVAAGLGIWWISGGPHGNMILAGVYCFPSLRAVWNGTMEDVVAIPEWEEVLAKNPKNRDRFLQQDRKEFLATMERWAQAYCACGDPLVPGLTDEEAHALRIPILIFRSGGSDMFHTRATSERLARELPNTTLVEPPWPDREWIEGGERSAAGNGTIFSSWQQLVPQLVEWADETIR